MLFVHNPSTEIFGEGVYVCVCVSLGKKVQSQPYIKEVCTGLILTKAAAAMFHRRTWIHLAIYKYIYV